ncbi:MAG: non-homologous end-joining DNA ligase [Methyloceanibacter sp.]|nr:non-homologous end-joining DNA ligase [Methyloceanibacter sp.]
MANETAANDPKRAPYGGITLTNPDRVFYPSIGLTKADLAAYDARVAPAMLPFVARRPISLVRCPSGLGGPRFFQRHASKGMSDAIKQVAVPASETVRPYLYIEDADGLFALTQIGTLEIHDWGVSIDRLDQPDRLVFDLDPDEGLRFGVLREAARHVKDVLAELGLTSFLRATGGKGVHVVAPLAPKAGWPAVKDFSRAVADSLVRQAPDRYTANPLKRSRTGKIFIDYLRNSRGNSAICNYSPRAKPGAPVAVPLRWRELAQLESGAPYTVKTLPTRLSRLKGDPWEGFFAERQTITPQARRAIGLD